MDYLMEEKPDGITAAYEFEKMRLRYPDNIVKGQLNLLDSHDVPRFLSMCHGEGPLWKLGMYSFDIDAGSAQLILRG